MRTVPGFRKSRRSPLPGLLAAAVGVTLGFGAATAPTASAAAGGGRTVTLHVAPTGNDRANGSAARPFRTVERAQEAARKEVRKPRSRPVDVVVHAGTYRLDHTLTFGPEDSGTDRVPVRYLAAPGERVVISGGRSLRPEWKSYDDTVKVADIGTGLDFDGLFLDGQRQVLARYPDYDPKTAILGGYAADAISAQRAARWKNPTTALVRGLHQGEWGGNSYRVTGLKADGTPQLDWVGDNNRGSGLHTTYRMVENVFEELDAPGEWFYDKAAYKLYFYPPKGADLASAHIETAELDELIRVQGGGPDDAVHDLSFSGFTFARTHRTLFDQPYEKLQLGDWAIARRGGPPQEHRERRRARLPLRPGRRQRPLRRRLQPRRHRLRKRVQPLRRLRRRRGGQPRRGTRAVHLGQHAQDHHGHHTRPEVRQLPA